MASKGIQIQLKVAGHGSCEDVKHDDCDWEKILHERLTKLFTDMEISKPETRNNLMTFNMAFKNRPTTKAEVSWRLSDFFSHHPVMTMASLKLK